MNDLRPGAGRAGGDNAEAMRARFTAGDPIRGGAAFIVFTFHVALAALFITGFEFSREAQRDAFGTALPTLLDNAEMVVYAFFVLSGYLIGRPFVQAYLGYRDRPRLRRYARRRFMRVMPAFWIVVTLAVLRFGTLGSSPQDVVGIYALLQIYDLNGGPLVQGVLGQLWTVHVEAWFYFLLPLAALAVGAVARHASGNRRITVLFVALLSVSLASLAVRQALPHTLPYERWAAGLMFAFVPGVALAALETVLPEHAAGRAWARRLAYALVVAGALLCLLFNEWFLRSAAITGTIATFATTCLVGGALLYQWSGSGCWRMLDNRPLHWLGERSYSFYLVHVPILWEMQLRLNGRVDDPWTAFVVIFAITLVLSLAAATLGYRYVERPCLGLDPWFWQRRRHARPSPAVAPEG